MGKDKKGAADTKPAVVPATTGTTGEAAKKDNKKGGKK